MNASTGDIPHSRDILSLCDTTLTIFPRIYLLTGINCPGAALHNINASTRDLSLFLYPRKKISSGVTLLVTSVLTIIITTFNTNHCLLYNIRCM